MPGTTTALSGNARKIASIACCSNVRAWWSLIRPFSAYSDVASKTAAAMPTADVARGRADAITRSTAPIATPAKIHRSRTPE